MSDQVPLFAAVVAPGAADLPGFGVTPNGHRGAWIHANAAGDITVIPAGMPASTTPIVFSVLAGAVVPCLVRRVTASTVVCNQIWG